MTGMDKETLATLLRTFEGHSSGVYSVAISPDGRQGLSGSEDQTLKLWELETGKLLRTFKGHSDVVHSVAISPDGGRALSGSEDKTFKLWELAVKGWVGGCLQYVNAKVVLVGDSGVGKSGLRLVLSGKSYETTDSTHGRFVETFSSEKVPTDSGEETRETLLWDLAGQPGYRLVHQLQLREVSVAIIVFDAKSEIDPFGGIRHWVRALAQAQRVQGANAPPLKKFLVAARMDRDSPSVSRKSIESLMADLGFDGYFQTSAKEGTGIVELQNAIRQAIPWDELPKVTSNELFDSIKTFLLNQKKAGRLLLPR